MKNLKFNLLIAFAAIGTLVLSSCGTDEPEVKKPVLNFLAGAGYTSADGDIIAGSDFKVGLSASHESKIEKLEITVSYDGGSRVAPLNCTICDTTINETSFTIDFNNTVEATPGSETWFFTVTDKDGNSTERSITFNRTTVPGPIRKIDVTLGNQLSSSVGSSLSLEDISVKLLADAAAASENIDLIYVKDENTGTSYLGAASSTTVQTWLPSVANWATKNATKIRKTSYSSGQFGTMDDSEELLDEIRSSAAGTDNVEIAEGDVFYVGPVSANGKHVLVKITSIGVDDTISVQVLVEE
ncbi:MAG: hypothetical protein JJ975_05135 [Bacteroidia bacterium]|nr:hypothetical protein [Bacteroidia bacterium]